jgi:hypothetical protein
LNSDLSKRKSSGLAQLLAPDDSDDGAPVVPLTKKKSKYDNDREANITRNKELMQGLGAELNDLIGEMKVTKANPGKVKNSIGTGHSDGSATPAMCVFSSPSVVVLMIAMLRSDLNTSLSGDSGSPSMQRSPANGISGVETVDNNTSDTGNTGVFDDPKVPAESNYLDGFHGSAKLITSSPDTQDPMVNRTSSSTVDSDTVEKSTATPGLLSTTNPLVLPESAEQVRNQVKWPVWLGFAVTYLEKVSNTSEWRSVIRKLTTLESVLGFPVTTVGGLL